MLHFISLHHLFRKRCLPCLPVLFCFCSCRVYLPKDKCSCWAVSSTRTLLPTPTTPHLHTDCRASEHSTLQLIQCTNGCSVCQQLWEHANTVHFNWLIDDIDRVWKSWAEFEIKPLGGTVVCEDVSFWAGLNLEKVIFTAHIRMFFFGCLSYN